jgi:hypothetical protein
VLLKDHEDYNQLRLKYSKCMPSLRLKLPPRSKRIAEDCFGVSVVPRPLRRARIAYGLVFDLEGSLGLRADDAVSLKALGLLKQRYAALGDRPKLSIDVAAVITSSRKRDCKARTSSPEEPF